jgi:DNA-binding NarL/FixJ family response regulator
MTRFRALVVDDVAEFRHLFSSALKNTQCEVVGEATDGLEAVHQAEQLQPDLILLDIGLPNMNGMDAARRIRKLSPNCKILFVSQISSPEIAEGAMRLGAHGYLLKSDTADLPSAVKAVLQGGQFVSSRVKSP